MVELNVEMTPDELAKAKEWVKAKFKRKDCPVCGDEAWTVESAMASTPCFKIGKGTFFGPLYPFVLVICEICGYTHFLNAVSMGLVESEEEGGQQDGN